MKTVIWNRVSTREQEQGYSLEQQEKLNSEYAKRLGFTDIKSFSISESASKTEQRKKFDEMLNYVSKNNVVDIISEKVDRFTRRIKEAAAIHDWLVEDGARKLHFVKESLVINRDSKSHEKLILNMKVAIAQFYADNLSEEVKKGQQGKLESGWYPGPPKLGYKTIELERRKVPIPDENTSALVKKGLELFATGNYSVQKLANTMFEEGLRSKKGFKVSPGRIHEMLTDPFYYGPFYWRDELHYEFKHEPLITEEIFNKNQSLLKRKNAPKYTVHNYLLKGLTKCSECGKSITWELQKGKLYGYCNHYKSCTQIKSVNQADVENQIIVCLEALKIKNERLMEWIRKAIKEGYKDETEYHTTVLSDLEGKLKQEQKRIDNLVDMRVDEQIDKENFDKKLAQYKAEKEKIVQAIKSHSQLQVKQAEYSVSFYELAQRAREIYEKVRLEEKRKILRLMFSSLQVKPNTMELIATFTKPFQILAEVVELTNNSNVVVAKVKTDKIFEHQEKTDTSIQTPAFLYAYPVLRRGRDSNSR